MCRDDREECDDADDTPLDEEWIDFIGDKLSEQLGEATV